jgi:hypothetical protein
MQLFCVAAKGVDPGKSLTSANNVVGNKPAQFMEYSIVALRASAG